MEEQGRRQATDPASDNYAVVRFARINDVVGEGIVDGITNGVARFENFEGVAVCVAVLADSAISGEFVFYRSGEQFDGLRSTQQSCPCCQEGGTEEVAPGDVRIRLRLILGAQRFVSGHALNLAIVSESTNLTANICESQTTGRAQGTNRR